jgi:glycyl-tRNA synthetase alpha chain
MGDTGEKAEGAQEKAAGTRLALPAYEQVLKAAHLQPAGCARRDLRDRACRLYRRIRNLSRQVAQAYYDSREALGFPMCKTEARA